MRRAFDITTLFTRPVDDAGERATGVVAFFVDVFVFFCTSGVSAFFLIGVLLRARTFLRGVLLRAARPFAFAVFAGAFFFLFLFSAAFLTLGLAFFRFFSGVFEFGEATLALKHEPFEMPHSLHCRRYQ